MGRQVSPAPTRRSSDHIRDGKLPGSSVDRSWRAERTSRRASRTDDFASVRAPCRVGVGQKHRHRRRDFARVPADPEAVQRLRCLIFMSSATMTLMACIMAGVMTNPLRFEMSPLDAADADESGATTVATAVKVMTKMIFQSFMKFLPDGRRELSKSVNPTQACFRCIVSMAVPERRSESPPRETRKQRSTESGKRVRGSVAERPAKGGSGGSRDVAWRRCRAAPARASRDAKALNPPDDPALAVRNSTSN